MILVRPTDTKEYLNIIARYKNSTEPFLGIGITSQLTVYDTGKGDINLNACSELQAIVIPYVSNGGTAVSNIGDLSIYFGVKGNHSNWCKYMFKSIKLWLISQGINAVEENNDITIHGKKIMGYTEHPHSEYSSGSIFIAMTNSQELVSKICLKPKTRKTAGLNEYGITAYEISEVIITATQNYLNSLKLEGDNKC